jgi:hypothetical protein
VSALADVRPEDFLRAGALCGQLAEDVTDSVTRAQRSVVPHWIGDAHDRYRTRLLDLTACLRRVSGAYDEASTALLLYSRALEEVRALTQQADAAGWHAGQLRAGRQLPPSDPLHGFVQAPVTPEEVLLGERERVLRAQAQERYAWATAQVVGTLGGLAAAAQQVSGWTSVDRSVEHAWDGARDQLVGAAHLAGSLLGSLPFVGSAQGRHDARQELKGGAKAMLQPWQVVGDFLSEVRDGQYGYAGGSLAGGLVLRKAGAHGRKVELFGAHDDMHLPVLYALRRAEDLPTAEAWVAAHAQEQFLDELRRLRQLPLPSVEALIAQGANLMQHEAYGGHTLLKHIGRDADWLRLRQQLDPTAKGSVSSFASLDQAEQVVAATLAANAERLRAWAHTDEARIELVSPLTASAGFVLDEDGVEGVATLGVVRMGRLPDGSVRVITAFVE